MKSLGIEERIREHVAKKIRADPIHTNRASEIGHDCLRYLVYLRTENTNRLLHDATLELIFREGKLHEPAIIRSIEDAGIAVIEQQRAFKDDDLNITGHIDGKMIENGRVIPFDAKTASHHIFERLVSATDVIEAMLHAKEPWLRKYPAQITCYLALDKGAKDEGAFVFKNKVTGRIVDRIVEFDERYWEALKMRAEAVNFHVSSKTLPGRIDDERICTVCAFRHMCLPDVDFGDEVDFVRELEDLLERREELRRQKKAAAWLRELEAVEEQVKAMVAGRNKVIAGRWRGTATEVNVKERVTKAFSYQRWNWKKADETS